MASTLTLSILWLSFLQIHSDLVMNATIFTNKILYNQSHILMHHTNIFQLDIGTSYAVNLDACSSSNMDIILTVQDTLNNQINDNFCGLCDVYAKTFPENFTLPMMHTGIYFVELTNTFNENENIDPIILSSITCINDSERLWVHISAYVSNICINSKQSIFLFINDTLMVNGKIMADNDEFLYMSYSFCTSLATLKNEDNCRKNYYTNRVQPDWNEIIGRMDHLMYYAAFTSQREYGNFMVSDANNLYLGSIDFVFTETFSKSWPTDGFLIEYNIQDFQWIQDIVIFNSSFAGSVTAGNDKIYLHGSSRACWRTIIFNSNTEKFENKAINIDVPVVGNVYYYRDSPLAVLDDNVLLLLHATDYDVYPLYYHQTKFNSILSYYAIIDLILTVIASLICMIVILSNDVHKISNLKKMWRQKYGYDVFVSPKHCSKAKLIAFCKLEKESDDIIQSPNTSVGHCLQSRSHGPTDSELDEKLIQEIIANENEYRQYIKRHRIDGMDQIDEILAKVEQLPKIPRLYHRVRKFNQLCTDNKNNNIYNFGVAFEYGYEGEWIEKNSIKMSAKYSSLKSELIQNNIAMINIDQFNNECNKAQIHLDSYSRKWRNKIDEQYLLSLLIYCNYTNYQNKWSSTFRRIPNNETNSHFGDSLIDNADEKFYHGISEQLIFPPLISSYLGMKINAPLSTSSSFKVAVNFTDNNNGLIMQFGGNMSRTKYFSMSWLSDYGNEEEYLFIQNAATLQINNIIDTKFGDEFDIILKSLKIIDQIITASIVENHVGVTSSLIKEIINYRLSIQSSNRFTDYGQTLINAYYNNKISMQFDYQRVKTRNPFIFKTLFDAKYEWINIDAINILFPNIESIAIENINICTSKIDKVQQFYWNYYKDNHEASKLSLQMTSHEFIQRIHKQVAKTEQNKNVFYDTTENYYLIKQKIQNPTTVGNIVNSTSWCNINVFKNSNATKMTGISMNKCVFISSINQFNGNKYNNIDLIPIKTKTDIECVWIVKISEEIHIGISLKYIPQTDDIKVMNIYLDKKQIQNQLVMPNCTCNYLDYLSNDNIYTLIINEDNTQYFTPLYSYESELYSDTESEDWEYDETDSELDEKLDEMDIKNFYY